MKIKYMIDGEIRAKTLAGPEKIDQLTLTLLHADVMEIVHVGDDTLCLAKIMMKLDEVGGLKVWNSQMHSTNITLSEQKLKNVDKFKHLETYSASPLHRTSTMAKTVSKRTPKQALKTSCLYANLDNHLKSAAGRSSRTQSERFQDDCSTTLP